MTYSQSRFLLVIIILLGVHEAIHAQAQEIKRSKNAVPVQQMALRKNQQSLLKFDSTQIARFFTRFPNLSAYEQNIRSFYSKRQYTFAWFDKDGLVEQATIRSNKLMNAAIDGVYSDFFYQKTLDSLIDEQRIKSKKTTLNIDLELLLSCLYFYYPKTDWSVNNQHPLPDAPVYRQYELLKKQLTKYQALEKSGQWSVITLPKKGSRLGDSAIIVTQVKTRLFKLEDFKGDTLNKSFNQALASAIESFQQRNGLLADGRLNAQTIAALNVPLKNRIKQIVVNMERSRWLPLHVAGDHLAVNIPEFKVHVYHSDSLLWSSNAIVGKAIHPTTQFYGAIKYVVFSPYWNVPPGILRNEIIPALKKDPNYLAKHHMEITGYNKWIPVIRQKPGKQNSLGLVKFLFPNSYNIYLHDTPTRSLFNETSRAFSHGCIRIENPQKLAGYLLRDRGNWGQDNIKMAMQNGKEKYVTLSKPVPVFIAYFTAFIDRDNRLNFRKDIYNLDNKLYEVIQSEDGYLNQP